MFRKKERRKNQGGRYKRMDKFTVEEINLMCVFEGQDRSGMIADIKNVISHIQDSDMVELSKQVLEKLEAMSDEDYAEVALNTAE